MKRNNVAVKISYLLGILFIMRSCPFFIYVKMFYTSWNNGLDRKQKVLVLCFRLFLKSYLPNNKTAIKFLYQIFVCILFVHVAHWFKGLKKVPSALECTSWTKKEAIIPPTNITSIRVKSLRLTQGKFKLSHSFAVLFTRTLISQ